MGHKSSEAGSDSEDSERRMQVKNGRKKNSSGQICPEDKLLKKNNKNSIKGGKVENDYRRNRNNDRISSGGGGLEKNGRQNKNYNETIPEEVTGEVDEETQREPVGQMFSNKAQSNTPPPSKIRNNSDVEGVGKGEQAAVEKLSKNPNHTNSNESLVPTAVMMVGLCCDGCVDNICTIIKKTKGYHDMSIDRQRNAVTVKGPMDMEALATRVSKKLSNRTVRIVPPDDDNGLQADAVSPPPEKDMVGGASKTGKGTSPQKELDGNKSNKPPVLTTVLKVDVPCGCKGHFHLISSVVADTKGCHLVKMSSDEMGKAMVIVTGTMDATNAVKEKLEKLKKWVEIAPPPPLLGDLDHGGSDNKRGPEQRKSASDGGGSENNRGREQRKSAADGSENKRGREQRKSAADGGGSENKRGREQRKSAADGGGGHAKENFIHYEPTEYPNPSIYCYDGDYSFQLLRELCPF